jgi:hypothetical protein
MTSALVGGERSVSRLGRFTPEERAHDTDWIGGGVGPRACLGDVKWKFLPPQGLEIRILGRPAHSQSLYRLKYQAVLRKIIELSGKDIIKWWRKFHNDGVRNLYSSQNISRRMRLVRNVVRVEEMRNTYKVLARNPWNEERAKKTYI